MLWIALHLHQLALEVFERARLALAPHGQPASDAARLTRYAPYLAVCDAGCVLQACEAALRAGVRCGMPRATAQALVPNVLLLERDAARESDALAHIAHWALQFTPHVALQPPDGVLLEVAASLRLFGGQAALAARLHAGLAELGFSAARGVAPTATGAWLLARAASRRASRSDQAATLDAPDPDAFAERFAALPVALLEAAVPHAQALDAMGLRTVGQLLGLPRAALARRFGPALLTEIDRAQGALPDPRAWHEAPAVFHARLELLAQVESADALLLAARRLLAQLAGWLAARQAATACVMLAAEHDGRPATTIELRLAEASRDASRLALVLRERLATIELPEPVHTLRLACEAVVLQAAASSELFASPADAREGLVRLLERLQARLGRGRIVRLRAADDHRPERAWRTERIEHLPAVAAGARPARTGARAPGALPAGLPRPLWLLAEPMPLAERHGRPWHHGPLRLVAGPERIEAGWWDEHLVQRDYFVAEGDDAALYWVFVERGTQNTPPGWFLHGRFA